MRVARPRLLGVAGLLVAGLVATTIGPPAAGAPVPGSAGVDTSLPATDSQVTVRGRGPFADLAITVNQTRNLVHQAISLTWTGGTPTRQGPGRFAAHYLQIMQCWGEDDGTVPANPGPPPEQCVAGAVGGVYGGVPGGLLPNGFAPSRIISRSGWPGFDPAVGVLDPRTSNVWRPFRAVDGTEIAVHTDPNFNPAVSGGNFWLNTFFDVATTNEVPAAVTAPDGTGTALFQVLTGMESSGLGCGQRVQRGQGGELRIPRCWLVVVPRGEPAAENAGTPFEEAANEHGVVTSPLSPGAWQHRIAIPLEFNPLDSPCSMAEDDRRLVGSELLLPAVASWQPKLCEIPGLPPFSFAPVSDVAARQQLLAAAPGGPSMVVVSRPVPHEAEDPERPIAYAPLSLSGMVIGFNIERNPLPDAPRQAQDLSGVRVAELNLTPRLVAKLLTQSYRQQVEIVSRPDYPWLEGNPRHMGLDPDFLQFNPEFELLQIASGRNFGGLVLPGGTSDAARQVWEWVLADPEASAWLAGAPDPWGMQVNPIYLTTPENPAGIAFADPPPDSFPKSDPYCHVAPPRGHNDSIVPPPLCGTDWMPYALSFGDAARRGRAADDRARIVENPFPLSSSDAWVRDTPQFLGRRAMLVLTDSASAQQFGLQQARLSRAGDNGPGRSFVAPDEAGLTAGARAMRAADHPVVLEPDPGTSAPGAYPLTTLVWAAALPHDLDAATRSDLAAFLEYAAGPGQQPGVELGRLPRGYVPLPEELKRLTLEAAAAIRDFEVPADADPEAPPAPAPPAPTPAPTAALPPDGPAPVPVAAPDPMPVGGSSPTPAADIAAGPQIPAPVSDAPGEPSERPTAIGQATPAVTAGATRLALPALGALALLSALGALEITKRPRTARREAPPAMPAAGRL